jgi:hypothetical protein
MASPHESRATRLALVAFAVAALATVLAFLPFHAEAQQPPQIRDRITDQTGVLQNDTGGITEALSELEREQGVQLYVLFVRTTGSMSVTEFVDATAAANSFGGNDALLLVATEDRTDALWVSESETFENLTDGEIDDALGRMEARLAAGDFAGAVTTLADRVGQELGEGSSGGGGISSTLVIIVLVIAGLFALAFGVVWVVGKVRDRRARQVAAEERDRQTGELAREANQLLLQADDTLRNATQELGFAEAEFEEADVAPFREALAAAKESLAAAFTVRQQLDDDRPEDPETRRKMLEEVVARSRAAMEQVNEETERLERLRDLEQNAPRVLEGLPARLDALDERTAEAERQLPRLRAFADAIWQPVQGNVAEARKRLGFARAQVKAGSEASAAGKKRDAATAVRAAEKAAAEATGLIEALVHQVEAAEKARTTLPGELAAAEADVTAATRAVGGGEAGERGDDLVRAQELLARARQAAAQSKPDILTALELALQANAAADAVLARVRTQQEQREREAAATRAALDRAEASYRQAADFIAGRSHGVGREARTRLASAERHLRAAQSLVSKDGANALNEARQAQGLAEDAYRIARSDFGRIDGGGFGKGSPGGSGGLGNLGAIILGGILTGGMRGGGGFGGTPWGSGGRSRGGGFGVPRMGGGGGGRSRGGHW